MVAVIYVRQSLDREGNRQAVERQLQACQELCDRRGWVTIDPIEDNDVSASKGKRDGYDKLLQHIEQGEVDVVVAWAVDRLTRKLTDLEDLISVAVTNNVKIVTVSGDLDLSNPMGRLLARIMASVARNEADQKGLRHRLANQQAAEKGRAHISRRAFGYKGTTDLVVVDHEADVLLQMALRFTSGHSCKDVAYWANEQGYLTTEGKLWHPITVRNTLNRPLYAGIRMHNGVAYKGNWKQIFNAELWETIKLTTKLRKERTGNRPKARRYLLTGLVFCGRCGRPMNGETKRDRPGSPLRRIYVCRLHGNTQKKAGCGLTRNAPALEDWTFDSLSYRLDTPDLSELLKGDSADDGRLGELLDRRGALTQRASQIMDDYGTGLLDREEMQRAKICNNKKIAELDTQIDQLNRQRRAAGLVPMGQPIREAFEKSESDEYKRGILGLVIAKIIVKPGLTKPFYKNLGRFDRDLIDFVWRV
jgi:DNA invertase Pin-like site-specific DNA recombinase